MVPQMPLLISFDVEEVRKQAAASTQRFEEGNDALASFIEVNAGLKFIRVYLQDALCRFWMAFSWQSRMI